MNTITIIGRVGADPEIFTTQKGTKITSFTVADNEYNGDDERTIWINVKCFGKMADVAERYLSKGNKVGISGRLTMETWEKDGQKRQTLKVIADKIELLTPKEKEDEIVEAEEPF